MPTLLHLDSSADLQGSVSRVLTRRFRDGWSAHGPENVVVRRDLHTEPLPHLPSHALHWAPRLRTPDETVPAEAQQLQDTLIAEVDAADVLVIGAPLYNWSIPSTLKAWIDYLHVPGTTTTFDVPCQPFAGKPVVVVSSRGASYAPGSGNETTDHEIPALQQVLGTALGMTVHVVTAELTLAPRIPAMAPRQADGQASFAAAAAALDTLVAALAGAGSAVRH